MNLFFFNLHFQYSVVSWAHIDTPWWEVEIETNPDKYGSLSWRVCQKWDTRLTRSLQFIFPELKVRRIWRWLWKRYEQHVKCCEWQMSWVLKLRIFFSPFFRGLPWSIWLAWSSIKKGIEMLDWVKVDTNRTRFQWF